MKLGLTGTFGSGKSTVARILAEKGARVIDADALSREATAPGSPALEEIRQAFGPEMVRPDGSLDRSRLGQVVFQDASARERLNAIIHPRVRQQELALLETYERQGAGLIVLDVPLLLENGLDAYVDRVVVVTVDEETRRERLRRDRGLSDEQIAARVASQMPQDQKVARADRVIDNGRSLEATRAQVEALLRDLSIEDRQ